MSAGEVNVHVTFSLRPVEDVQATGRAKEAFDYPHPERTFTMRPDRPVPIGRASSSVTKSHLASATGNLFIDSPVISRDHAVLSTNSSSGSPRVYLTDVGSMHGTLVNDEKLTPHKAHPLENGDLMQFGTDITRNQDFFVARQWQFQYQPIARSAPVVALPETSYARGFTVPDDSEDDIEMEENLSSSPALGSQNNPVTIADSDDRGHTIIGLDHDDCQDSSDEESEERESSLRPALYTFSEEPATTSRPYVPSPYSFGQDHSSNVDPDMDDEESIYSSDSNSGSHEYGNMSEHSSVSISENSMFGPEQSDSGAEDELENDEEVEKEEDAVRRMKLGAMVNFEQQKRAEEATSSNTYVVPSPVMPLAAPAPRSQDDSQVAACGAQAIVGSVLDFDAPEPIPWNDYMHTTGPPRPTAPKPFSWPAPNSGPFAFKSYPENSWSEGTSLFDAFSGRSFPPQSQVTHTQTPGAGSFDSHMIISGLLPMPENTSSSAEKPIYGDHSEARDTVPALTVDRVHTPPMLATEDPAFITPQPNRRTKVSIPEIVENMSHQPPTPTSIASVKRKADVLDDVDHPTPTQDQSVPSVQITVATAQPAQLGERPRKKARVSEASTRRAAAAGLVIGSLCTVGAFGALLAFLPNQFFEP